MPTIYALAVEFYFVTGAKVLFAFLNDTVSNDKMVSHIFSSIGIRSGSLLQGT